MTKQEIKKELSKIYLEMKRWPIANKKLNYLIPKEEVERREDLIYLQQILYKIQDSQQAGDKNKGHFNLALYHLAKVGMA